MPTDVDPMAGPFQSDVAPSRAAVPPLDVAPPQAVLPPQDAAPPSVAPVGAQAAEAARDGVSHSPTYIS